MRQDWNQSPIAGALSALRVGVSGRTADKSIETLQRWLLEASRALARRYRLSGADAEDALASVLLAAVKRSADPAWAESVVNAEAYLFTSLSNAWRTLHRRRAAEARRLEALQSEEAVSSRVVGADSASSSEDAFDVDDARRKLSSMLAACIEEALLEARNDDEREERRRAIEQVLSLHARTRTMEEVLAEEGLSAGSTKEERVRLRNRLQKRHERARAALRTAAEALEERGELSPDLAQRMKLAVGLLRRCQRPSATRVDRGGKPG